MVRFSYVALSLFLFAVVNCPKDWIDRLRSDVVVTLSPLWQSVSTIEAAPQEVPVLHAYADVMQEWAAEERRMQSQMDAIAALLGQKDSKIKSDLMRRIEREKKVLSARSLAMPARVIFRDPASWSSSLWISIGEADNQEVGLVVVAPNSPVMAGNALIGVVEYVGESQSRVRLITDAGLTPSVRAVRGGAQNQELFHHVQNLLSRVRVRPDLFSNGEEQERFITMLSAFQSRISDGVEEEMAKGEICGCSAPFFRARGAMLKGIGFNYDFPDEAGPARDLRSGQPVGVNSSPGAVLIQPGDLLVTSGLDGMFPAGIPVAVVTQIAPIKDGGFTYDLVATPAAGDLMDLSVVFVLPSQGM